MDFTQSVIIGIAFSGPIAIFVGIGRTIMFLDRSVRARHTKFAVVAGLGILFLLILLAAVLVVWFAYGVAHTGKDATTDFAVLAGTVVPAYAGVFCIWRLSGYLEKKRLRDNALDSRYTR
ncbi:MAG: hypothetical protein R3E82_20135 [Pseudomonadales bacterium]|nr:hypothetical protein [Pseudomonadales bacterium]